MFKWFKAGGPVWILAVFAVAMITGGHVFAEHAMPAWTVYVSAVVTAYVVTMAVRDFITDWQKRKARKA